MVLRSPVVGQRDVRLKPQERVTSTSRASYSSCSDIRTTVAESPISLSNLRCGPSRVVLILITISLNSSSSLSISS